MAQIASLQKDEGNEDKIKQLQELVKLMRPIGKARQYPITKKKKADLIQMIVQLHGGYHVREEKSAQPNLAGFLLFKYILKPLFNSL